MSALDDIFLPGVKALLVRLGAPAELTHVAKVYSPTTGATVETTTVEMVRVSPPVPYDTQYETHDVVNNTDLYCLISALGLLEVPKMPDRLKVYGITMQVVGVSPIASGEQICAYKLHLKR